MIIIWVLQDKKCGGRGPMRVNKKVYLPLTGKSSQVD